MTIEYTLSTGTVGWLLTQCDDGSKAGSFGRPSGKSMPVGQVQNFH
jgi:hypothetical protein